MMETLFMLDILLLLEIFVLMKIFSSDKIFHELEFLEEFVIKNVYICWNVYWERGGLIARRLYDLRDLLLDMPPHLKMCFPVLIFDQKSKTDEWHVSHHNCMPGENVQNIRQAKLSLNLTKLEKNV